MTTDETRGAGREMDRVSAMAAQVAAATRQSLPDGPDGSQVRLVPPGWSLERLAPVVPPLLPHVSQVISVDEADSFTLYYEAFATPQTRLFADVRHGVLTAVLDYHDAGSDETEYADPAPGRLAHRLVYAAPKSVEWQRWADLHRRAIDQEALLEFLEENAQDIVRPAAADVLEMVTEFRSIRSTRFSRKMNLTNGSVAMSFSDEEAGDQTVHAPSEMTIHVPVFEGGERVEIKVFLRTRAPNGKLSFLLVIHRKELVERELFRETVRGIEETLSTPVWWGRIS
ncbi:DUF2303 family protein [Acuticoccus sediminis]|uniref:DUF2303 family protein n=1 Tax=Acuticoccus sediminis TaxID=2184697 RepID=UPI001CFF2E64|nr:DUF2303 family protein [Acuticoccus sediminis]